MKISKKFATAALALATLATAGCRDQYVKTESGEIVQKFEWEGKPAYKYPDGGVIVPQPQTNTVRLIYHCDHTEYRVDYAEKRFCTIISDKFNISRTMDCSDFSEIKSEKNKQIIEKSDDYFKVTRAPRP